jgi:hypothetical protein
VGVAVRWGREIPYALRLPSLATAAALAAACLYRLPALVLPRAWVNRDGAYPAFVALHLMQGIRPAPIFTEGAHYQGTLKGHLGALIGAVTGVRDLPLLMVLASLLLYLAFVAATMAVVRRIAGREAALFAGLYVAISPRFVTVFSLNCVGQYVDVLALGGLALVVIARLLAEDRRGPEARGSYLGAGLFAAFCGSRSPGPTRGGARAGPAARPGETDGRCRSRRAPSRRAPVLIWNAQNHWQTVTSSWRSDPGEPRRRPTRAIRRTLTISFPTLSAQPRPPWGQLCRWRRWATCRSRARLLPALRGREIAASIRGRPSPAVLPPSCSRAWPVLGGGPAASTGGSVPAPRDRRHGDAPRRRLRVAAGALGGCPRPRLAARRQRGGRHRGSARERVAAPTISSCALEARHPHRLRL